MEKLSPSRERIDSLLGVLHAEVVSSSGDGDAMWYTRYYKLDEIEELLHHYNEENNIGWEIERYEFNDRVILWGIDQEGVIITDDAEEFESSPDWIQMKIRY